MTNIQVFTEDQQHLIKKGNIHRQTLRSQINEALTNNVFKENFIVSSLPGLGKTYEMEEALKTMTNSSTIEEAINKLTDVLVCRGDNGIFGYTLDILTAIYLNGGPQNPLTVINDDCDILFANNVINTTKKMFDDTRILRYGRSYKGIKSLCSDMQWEAVLSFADESKAGLDIDVSNVTFITLTNFHLNTVDEVNKEEPGSTKYNNFNSRYAIRRRTQYKEIDMSTKELWGYVADVVLNEKICEKFMPNITIEHKTQMLNWCDSKWEAGITERNLSIIEKMTKDIVRFPNNYLDIWNQEYTSKSYVK